MAAPQDALKGFYESLKASPHVKGIPNSYEEFKSGMEDPEVANQVYSSLKSNPKVKGLPNNFNEFSSSLGLSEGKAAPVGSGKPSGVQGAPSPTPSAEPQTTSTFDFATGGTKQPPTKTTSFLPSYITGQDETGGDQLLQSIEERKKKPPVEQQQQKAMAQAYGPKEAVGELPKLAFEKPYKPTKEEEKTLLVQTEPISFEKQLKEKEETPENFKEFLRAKQETAKTLNALSGGLQKEREEYFAIKPQTDLYRQTADNTLLDTDVYGLQQQLKQAKGVNDFQQAAAVESQLNDAYKKIEAQYISFLSQNQPQLAIDKLTEYDELNKKRESGQELSRPEERFLKEFRDDALSALYNARRAEYYETKNTPVGSYVKDITLLNQKISDLKKEYNALAEKPLTAKSKLRLEQIKKESDALLQTKQQRQNDPNISSEEVQRYAKVIDDMSSISEGFSQNLDRFDSLKEEEIDRAVRTENRKNENVGSAILYSFSNAINQGLSGAAKFLKTELSPVNAEYDAADKLYRWADDWSKRAESVVGKPFNQKEWDEMSLIEKSPYLFGEGLGSVTLFAGPGAVSSMPRLATMLSAYVMSEPQAYEEAISLGLDIDDAKTYSRTVSLAEATIEGTIPDIKYFDAPKFRSGILQEIKRGVPAMDAIKNGIVRVTKEIADNTIKEGGEEFAAAVGSDAMREVNNILAGKDVYSNTFDASDIAEQTFAGMITGFGMGSIQQIAHRRSDVSEDVVLEMAENPEKVAAAVLKSPTEQAEASMKFQKEAQEAYDAVKNMPGFQNLSRQDKAAVVSEIQRKKAIESAEKATGISTEEGAKQIEEIDNTVKTILSKPKTITPPPSLTSEYDTQNIEGVPSPVGEREGAVEAQPIEGRGAEEAPPSGILEVKKEVVFPQSKQQETFYHGTPAGYINEFDESKIGTTTDQGFVGDYGKGFYFSPTENAAKTYAEGERGNVVSVKLDMKNPLNLSVYNTYQNRLNEEMRKREITALSPKFDELSDEIASELNVTPDEIEYMSDVLDRMNDNWMQEEFQDDLKKRGYDSVIAPNGERVVFDKKQIKIIDQTQKEPIATLEEEVASETEFAQAVDGVKEIAPDLNEADADFAASLVQQGATTEEAVDYVQSTPEAEREAPSQVVEEEDLLGKKEKVSEPTQEDIADTAKKTGISPKNLRDLYNINRDLFGLNRVKSFASAIAMDRMVGAMAKRAGLTREQMYGKLEFRKDTEENVLKADNALFQGTIDGKPTTLRNIDVDVVNGFYSPLEKIISETKQEKMPAKQWLDKFAKGEEAKWTGLQDWLSQQEGSVSKQDILNYLKDNRISVVEVVKGGDKYQDKLKDQPKFSQYQLEGEKENYKEVLVTLPSKVNEKRLQELIQKKRDKTITEKEEAEFKKLDEQVAKDFQSSHFDEPNILVHLRMNTRTDADGNKVLFLEEVQSDWGQKGKKEGFKIDSKEREFLIDAQVKINERFNKGEISKEDAVKLLADNEKKLAAIDKAIGDSLIPTAPFVMDTNAWTKLGLKVALKEAVAQGVDKIAWTTGTQQFDRWGTEKIDWVSKGRRTESETKRMNELGDKIVSMKETPSEREEYTRLAEKEGWTVNIQEQFRGTAFEGMNVDEKALSEKGITINSKEDLKAAIDRTLSREKTETERQKLTDRIWDRMQKEDSGTSLPRKEGMESFYGTEGTKGIVGGVAEKVFGQKVGSIELQTTKGTTTDNPILRLRDWVWKNKTEDYSYADAKKDIESNSKLYEEYRKNIPSQPSIDVTPTLRAEVERGLALFQRQQGQKAKGAMVAADGKFIIYAITDPNVSTPLHELAHVFEHYLTDDERAIVQNWAKTKAWTTQTSEAFAKGFEKYLAEGKASTTALQKVFDKFKTWLFDIYKGIAGSDIDIKLNDKMRNIYASMLDSDKVFGKETGLTKEVEGLLGKKEGKAPVAEVFAKIEPTATKPKTLKERATEARAKAEQLRAATGGTAMVAPKLYAAALDAYAAILETADNIANALKQWRQTKEYKDLNEADKKEIENEIKDDLSAEYVAAEQEGDVFADIDKALSLKGPESAAARKEFREKYGKEMYDRAIEITRNFDKIVEQLENQGKLKKKCP